MKNLNGLLKKVELFEKLAVYGDQSSYLQALAQQTEETWHDIAKQYGDVPEDPHTIPPPPAETLNVPETTIPAPVPGPSIDPTSLTKVQHYLSKMFPSVPVTSSGKWDPQTAKAVLQWGKTNNLNLGLQQLLDLIKVKAESSEAVKNMSNTPNLDKYRT